MALAHAILQRAVGLHQQGDLSAAEQLYRQVLRADADNPDALYLLGTLLYQQSSLGSASLFLRKACALRPGHPETHNNLGLVLQGQTKLAEAATEFDLALRLRSGYQDARFNLANVLREQGQCAAAVEQYRQVLGTDPERADAHDGLAAALETLGQHSEALAAADQALGFDPTLATAHNNRGAILRSLCRLPEAAAAFRQAVRLAPDFAKAHANLGAVLVQLGELQAALDHCRLAATMQPKDPVAHNNLGSVHYQLGDDGLAMEQFRAAVALKPDFAPAHHNLGNCLRRLGKLDEADACYHAALQLDPQYVRALASRGHLLEETDRLGEARDCFQRLAILEPANLLWKFRAASLCPTVFWDNEAISAYRHGLVAMLEECRAQGLRASFEDLLAAGFRPPFNLPFHGRDDRPIKELFASMFAPCFEFGPPAFGTGKPRVGFVVTERHERAFAKSIGGFFGHFDQRQLDAVVVCSKSGALKLRTMLPANVEYLELPEQPRAVLPALRGRFDLLYFWEIGTDPLNYFLPFCRLAPLQCTSWGIQVTSGIPAIDVYISGKPIEPEDATAHYSERLVLLETVLTYQHRLPPPDRVRLRESFGLAADGHVYLCPQHLGKFHPDFDAILGEILRRDPKGELVITAGKRVGARQQLEERFRARLSDVAERIRFLPNQAGDDYSCLLLLADVLLDPLLFGGVNTTFDALSLGKVIVTLPGRFQRGRYTYGCLRTIGVDAGIAESVEDYVARALRLAGDRDYRRSVEVQILEAGGLLFENAQAAKELQELLVGLVEAARS